MKFRTLTSALCLGSLACMFLMSSVGTVVAQTSYIYVESNIGKTQGQNSMLAYSNDGLGNLTALPGSPYLTAGTGVYDPSNGPTEFDADQYVITNSTGGLLFAVNGHSNTIASFTLNADGTLTTVPGSPFASGGQDPVSLGFLEAKTDILVAANKNEDPNQDQTGSVPNLASFTVNADGSLVANVGATIDFGVGSSPSQALMQSKSHLLFAMEFGTSQLDSYKMNKDGTMTLINSVLPPIAGDHFLGEIGHPLKRALYVGFPLTNGVGVYRYSATAGLSYVRTVHNNGGLVCWLTTNPAGTVLYTSETGSHTVSAYDISRPLAPVFLQQLTLSGSDKGPSNLALDPTGQFLYVLSGTSLHLLNIDTSGLMTETLTPLALPVASDETPLGVVVVRK